MTTLLFVGVAVAGGVGSALRFVIDGLIRARFATAAPTGIVTINITGSFLLGLITGLALAGSVTEEWRLVLCTGLLGGYTTFSTASLDTVRLLRRRRILAGALHGLGTLVACVAAGGLGLVLADLLTPA